MARDCRGYDQRARAFAAADAVLAQAITGRPSTDPGQSRVHWGGLCMGYGSREFLVTAESGVLLIAGTEVSRMPRAQRRWAAASVAVQSLASLSSVGVQVPEELREATAHSSTLSELALQLCPPDGVG